MEMMVAGAGPDQLVAWPWGWWLAIALLPPLLALAICHGNDAFHRAAFALKRWLHGRPRARLPPGHMGLPFVGENPALKRYFRRARRPDGFVHDKKRRYGDATAGLYRTHLFGSPAVLVCSPAANKLVLQSPDSFGVCWPAPDLVGASSIQPRVAAVLRSWAHKSTVTAAVETKKVSERSDQPQLSRISFQ